MERRLDKSEVQRWLAGQRETENVIRRERMQALLNRTPDESWKIYLSLTNTAFGVGRDASKPSHVLAAMRKALNKYAQRKASAP